MKFTNPLGGHVRQNGGSVAVELLGVCCTGQVAGRWQRSAALWCMGVRNWLLSSVPVLSLAFKKPSQLCSLN